MKYLEAPVPNAEVRLLEVSGLEVRRKGNQNSVECGQHSLRAVDFVFRAGALKASVQFPAGREDVAMGDVRMK